MMSLHAKRTFIKIAENQNSKPDKIHLTLEAFVMLKRETLEVFSSKEKTLFKDTKVLSKAIR